MNVFAVIFSLFLILLILIFLSVNFYFYILLQRERSLNRIIDDLYSITFSLDRSGTEKKKAYKALEIALRKSDELFFKIEHLRKFTIWK